MTRFKNIKLAYLTFFVLLTTVSSFAQEQKQTDSIKSKSSSLGPSSVAGQIDKNQTGESKLLKNYFENLFKYIHLSILIISFIYLIVLHSSLLLYNLFYDKIRSNKRVCNANKSSK